MHSFDKMLRKTVSHMLPLTLLVLAVDLFLFLFTDNAMPVGMLLKFLIGVVFLFVGMTLISIGEETAMVPMGERIGAALLKTGRYSLLLPGLFLIGALVTMAEPDIAVFVSQYPGLADRHMVFVIAGGVGVFLMLGVLRMMKKIPFTVTIAVLYGIVLVLGRIAPDSIEAVAFDSGGISTGPILVPFIMALGLGLSAARGRGGNNDRFGTVAVCAVGPVIALLLYGIFGKLDHATVETAAAHVPAGAEIITEFLKELPLYLEEVAFALAPIIVLFVLFQIIFLRLPKAELKRTGVGLVFSFIGHAVFLTGVGVGFLPAGEYMGGAIASLPGAAKWLVIPIGMLMGYFVVMAEPAVRVMNQQVEEVTVGAVTEKAMMTMISLGVAGSVGIAMLRVMTGVPLKYFLIGGYALAIALSLAVPRMFTGIAFDSGGVASGAMSLIFLLPFAKGASVAVTGSAGSLLTDAFGLMALVAMTPLISVQLLGLSYTIKLRRNSPIRSGDDSVTIVEFNTEEA